MENNKPKFRPNPDLKLMDQVREVLRYYRYTYRTEQTYCQWILRYIHYFGGKPHPGQKISQCVEINGMAVGFSGKVSRRRSAFWKGYQPGEC
jgi:hypothetical protein